MAFDRQHRVDTEAMGASDTRVKIARYQRRFRGIRAAGVENAAGTHASALSEQTCPKLLITPLPDGVLYVQFNQVTEAPSESLAAFAKRLDKTLTDTRPRTVVVDVRHNNGGNLNLLPPLLDALRLYEQANRDETIIRVDGTQYFSAAQVFLAQMDRYNQRSLRGRASSSRPNFVERRRRSSCRGAGR